MLVAASVAVLLNALLVWILSPAGETVTSSKTTVVKLLGLEVFGLHLETNHFCSCVCLFPQLLMRRRLKIIPKSTSDEIWRVQVLQHLEMLCIHNK